MICSGVTSFELSNCEGGNTQWRPGIHVRSPPGNRQNQENFALVIGKNKKNLDILPLKRVKFEIFARVIG